MNLICLTRKAQQKNAVLHKTAKMELSVFAPELSSCNIVIMFSFLIFVLLSTIF